VPAEPSFAELLQHAADAQDLSHNVVQQTVGFARSPYSLNRARSAVLGDLSMAVGMSSNAAPHFAETAEIAPALPRSTSPTDREHRANRMVAVTARAFPRRTSESLQDAARQRDSHLEFRRFFTTPSLSQSPALAPPEPAPRHRWTMPPPPPLDHPKETVKRPADMSDSDWAEYLQCQDEHDDLMSQVADREYQMESGLIDSYDEFQFDFGPLPEPKAPTRRITGSRPAPSPPPPPSRRR
jgi:hypothetical protein